VLPATVHVEKDFGSFGHATQWHRKLVLPATVHVEKDFGFGNKIGIVIYKFF
jgi:hypothetical protein